MRVRAMPAALAAGLALVACDPSVPAKPKTDVGARVNGVELPRLASAQAMERAIEQELVVQRAVSDGLEKDILVAAQIEAARRQVLTQAWFDRAAAAHAGVTDDEVRAFHAAHGPMLGHVALEQAAPSIRRHLARAKRAEHLRAEVNRLREQARIEYVADPRTERSASPAAPLHRTQAKQDATPSVAGLF